MKRSWQLLLGVMVSVICLYFALPGLHLAEFSQVLRTANYWWIIPGVLVYFVGLWVRSWRWQVTLHHFKVIPLQRLFPLVCIGYFGNNVYPLRAGEVLRSYALRQSEGIAMSSSLATVIIERVFDGLVMLLFVFLALPLAPEFPSGYRNVVIALTVLLLTATAFFVWTAVQPVRIAAIYHLCAQRLLPTTIRLRTDNLYHRFMEGLQSLGRPSDVLMIFAISIIIWLIETVKYWFVMHAFDFQVTFLVLMLMNGIVNLATTLPSAPGHIGTFDAPGIAVLQSVAVDKTLAASYTLTLHAALWLPVTAVGAYYFWRNQLQWSDIARAEQQAKVAG